MLQRFFKSWFTGKMKFIVRFFCLLAIIFVPFFTAGLVYAQTSDGDPNVVIPMQHPELIGSQYPELSGSYISEQRYPHVFTTQGFLKDVVKRINQPGSFSSAKFLELTGHVEEHLSSVSTKCPENCPTDWSATYSGRNIYVYLTAYSIDSTGGYDGQTETDDDLRKAMNLPETVTPPRGAALVASQLALYAALVKAGAVVPSGAPSAEAAATLAQQIILAWAHNGFHDSSGYIYSYCDNNGKTLPVTPALQIARGVMYSVDAVDLLEYFYNKSDGFGRPDNNAEDDGVFRFHYEMYNVIRTLSNNEIEYYYPSQGQYFGTAYNNQFANHLAALLAIARLLDDRKLFMAALYGRDQSVPVFMPWVVLFNTVLYGDHDHQHLPMPPNTGPEPYSGLTSHPSFITLIVEPGEINDRYRNAESDPAQGIGYPMFTLERLFAINEMLHVAGFDAYRYRGSLGQSLELSMQYYACYGKNVGVGNPNTAPVITAENASSCPNYPQYIGKTITYGESGGGDLDRNILIGAYRFPGNQSISELNNAAQDLHNPAAIDPVLFGYWQN